MACKVRRIQVNQKQAISQQINEIGIELTVIGIDFDDEEYGYKEEDKSSVKRRNERILAKLVAGCTDGRLGTAAEAIELSVIPDVKETRPYKTYEGRLGKPIPSLKYLAGLRLLV